MRGPVDSGQAEAVSRLVRSLMPPHAVYAEPWFREGEVFFLKHPSRREVLNDPDERMVNFYITVRTRWQELLFLIESTLYCESLSQLADDIHTGRRKTDAVYRAWAVWLRYNRDRMNRSAWLADTSAWLAGCRESSDSHIPWLDSALSERLKDVLLTNRSVTDFVTMTDSPETFFYFRPPDRTGAAALTELLPRVRGSFCFWYPDRRIAEKVAAACSLQRSVDTQNNVVYTNFKVQNTLFDI